MNKVFQSSVTEIGRLTDAEETFAVQTERLKAILDEVESFCLEGLPSELGDQGKCFLPLLAPLVEVAWADKSVALREFDAILQAADIYGILDDESSARQLMQFLTLPVAPSTREQLWRQLERLFAHLPESKLETVERCLLSQAQFIAERCAGNFLQLLSGTRVCEREQDALRQLADKLQQIRATRQAASVSKTATAVAEQTLTVTKTNPHVSANSLPTDNSLTNSRQAANTFDDQRFALLTPMIKTAWADGEVTKHEYWLVCEAAIQLGIEPYSAPFQQLIGWLKQCPPDEFYSCALSMLQHFGANDQDWQTTSSSAQHQAGASAAPNSKAVFA